MAGVSASLGSALRTARAARNLTMAQVAFRAGVSHVTLSRWETGLFQPRVPELESVLRTLDVSLEERRLIFSLLDAPRALARTRTLAETEPEAVRQPVMGDLLRAMRLRRNLSREDIACALGTTSRTVRRWENSECAVPEERLDALCRTLGAEEEERAALVHHRIYLGNPGRGQSLDDLEAVLLSTREAIRAGESRLIDLRLLTLKAQLWTRGGEVQAQRLLAHAQLVHTEFLEARGRQTEMPPLLDQAMRLIEQEDQPDRTLLALALHAQGAIGRKQSGRAQFERLRYLLRRWQNFSQDQFWLACLYRDVAEAALEAGEPDAGLTIIRQGTEALRGQPETAIEWRLANHVQTRILIHLNRLPEAEKLLPASLHPNPYQRLWETYQRVEIYQSVGERNAAQDWLNDAYKITRQYGLNSDQADRLARQM